MSRQVCELQVTLHHLTALVEVAEHVQVGLRTGRQPQLHVCAGAHWWDREDGSKGLRSKLLQPATSNSKRKCASLGKGGKSGQRLPPANLAHPEHPEGVPLGQP